MMNRCTIKWNSFEQFHAFYFPSEFEEISSISGFDSEIAFEEYYSELFNFGHTFIHSGILMMLSIFATQCEI